MLIASPVLLHVSGTNNECTLRSVARLVLQGDICYYFFVIRSMQTLTAMIDGDLSKIAGRIQPSGLWVLDVVQTPVDLKLR